jgi:hypothetical protein
MDRMTWSPKKNYDSVAEFNRLSHERTALLSVLRSEFSSVFLNNADDLDETIDKLVEVSRSFQDKVSAFSRSRVDSKREEIELSAADLEDVIVGFVTMIGAHQGPLALYLVKIMAEVGMKSFSGHPLSGSDGEFLDLVAGDYEKLAKSYLAHLVCE